MSLRAVVRRNIIKTVCRVGLWSLFTALGAYSLFPVLQRLWRAGCKQDYKATRTSLTDRSDSLSAKQSCPAVIEVAPDNETYTAPTQNCCHTTLEGAILL